MKSEQFPWQMLIMISKYFFPKSVGERQPRAPHLQASSSSCKASVRWDFYFPWKISLNKLMVTLIWSKLAWSSQKNNAQTQKFSVPQGQHALNIQEFLSNTLLQTCVLAPLQGLGFNGKLSAWASVCAYRPMTVHRGICPGMSVIKLCFLGTMEKRFVFSWSPRRNTYCTWHWMSVMVTISLASKWLLRLKSSSLQSS